MLRLDIEDLIVVIFGLGALVIAAGGFAISGSITDMQRQAPGYERPAPQRSYCALDTLFACRNGDGK